MVLWDRAFNLVTVVGVLILPAYVALGARMYARWTRKNFGLDDVCMVIAGAFFLWLSYEMVIGATTGIGAFMYHFEAKDPTSETQEKLTAQLIEALRHLFMIEISFAFCVLWIKLGVTFMLLRVAWRPVDVWIIRTVGIVYVLLSLGVDFYVVFECTPIAYNWDESIPGGKCGPVDIVVKLTYVITAVNIFSDIFCVIMPIVVLRDVQMNKRTKAVSVILLGFGSFSSVCSIVRLGKTPQFSDPSEHLYKAATIMVWSYAEAGVGMITTNAAALRPLLASFLQIGHHHSGGHRQIHASPGPGPRVSGAPSSFYEKVRRIAHIDTLGSLRTGNTTNSSMWTFGDDSDSKVRIVQGERRVVEPRARALSNAGTASAERSRSRGSRTSDGGELGIVETMDGDTEMQAIVSKQDAGAYESQSFAKK